MRLIIHNLRINSGLAAAASTLIVTIVTLASPMQLADDNETRTPRLLDDADAFFGYPPTRRLADAAASGDATFVAALVSDRAPVNGQGLYGITPLMWATIHDNITGVRALLDAGADPNLKTDDGDTAVTLAARLADPVILEVLLSRRGRVNERGPRDITPLMIVATHGHMAASDLLLSRGAAVDQRDAGGNTALMYAAAAGELESLTSLLAAGANRFLVNNEGSTALDIAIQVHGSLDRIIEKLIITVNEIFDRLPDQQLASAAAAGDLEQVRAAIRNGADLNAIGNWGITPLLWALTNENLDGFRFLYQAGAHPGRSDSDIESVLFYAVTLEDPRFLEILLTDIRRVDIRGYRSLTPLMVASQQGRTDQARMLLDHGAEIHAKDSLGFTPLHHAVLSENAATIRLLVSAGADSKNPDHAGLSAEDYASFAIGGAAASILGVGEPRNGDHR